MQVNSRSISAGYDDADRRRPVANSDGTTARSRCDLGCFRFLWPDGSRAARALNTVTKRRLRGYTLAPDSAALAVLVYDVAAVTHKLHHCHHEA